MNRTLKLLASASVLAAAAVAATPAMAAGTQAGETITNEVTVNYSVNAVPQAAVEAEAQFVVDRKIMLSVQEVGDATTNVSPGQQSQVTAFDVTNSTNGTIDIKLDATNIGTAPHGGTDSFDVTNIRIFVDNESSGIVGSWDPADTQVPGDLLEDMAEDETRRVFIVADIPMVDGSSASLTNGDVAAVRLTGTAWTDAGVPYVTSPTNDIMGEDVVLADEAANGSAAYDGIAYDDDDYTIVSAEISVVKTNRVISDPVSGTNNPKMIPGAVVEYCIAITNNGTVSATDITITDPIPGFTTFASNSIVKDTTVNAGVCGPGTAVPDGTGYSTSPVPTVSVTLDESVDAGETWGVRFQVTID